MLGSDTKIGNSSQATQAAVTGSRLRLRAASLRYLQWTHRPRLSGSLISIGTLKKDTTCPRSIPTLSRTFFPAYSTTMNILCLLSSHLWTPAAIPRVLVCGAPGCRALGGRGDREGPEHISVQVKPQDPSPLASLLYHPPPFLLALMLHNPPKESSFNPQCILKASKIWEDPAVGWS